MTTLKAEKRDPQVKAKKLRREGFVTGVLYGKEMKENIALKFEEKEAKSARKTFTFGASKQIQNETNELNTTAQEFDSNLTTEINNNIESSTNNIVESV